MEPRAWVYMMTNRPRGVLYVGMSNAGLVRRVWQHRERVVPGFTKTYNLHRLVWFEPHGHVTEAAEREQRIKRWRREWKFALVEDGNPHWRDLYPEILG